MLCGAQTDIPRVTISGMLSRTITGEPGGTPVRIHDETRIGIPAVVEEFEVELLEQ